MVNFEVKVLCRESNLAKILDVKVLCSKKNSIHDTVHFGEKVLCSEFLLNNFGPKM